MSDIETTPQTRPFPAPVPRRRHWGRDLIAYGLLALMVFGVVAGVLVRQHRTVVPMEAWKQELDEEGKLRPVAEVAEMTRAMKLVTVEVHTTVSATMTDARWRGTASATVEAPVRYNFGVDLSKVENGAFRYDFLTRDYVLNLPPPAIIAVEIDGGNPRREEINVSGTRFKKLAGREQLVAAHKAIYQQARRQVLPAARRQEVREVTRMQVTQLVATIVGKSAGVKVRFEDE